MRRSKRATIPALIGLLAIPAFAHGGEDHPELSTESGRPAGGGPTLEGQSDLFEVLVRLPGAIVPGEESGATLYVAEAATNAPVQDAAVELTLSGPTQATVKAAAGEGAGFYAVRLPALAAGRFDVTATVTHGGKDDLLLMSELAVGSRTEMAAPPRRRMALCVPVGAVAIALAIAVAIAAARGRNRKRSAPIAAVAVLLLAAGHPSSAHEGEEDGPAAGAAAQAIVRVPKELQFSAGIRTAPVREEEIRASISVLGKVAAPPAARAEIAAPQNARIVPGSEETIPAFGSRVRKGQALCYLGTVAAGAERVGLVAEKLRLESEVTRARGELELKEAEVGRLRSLEKVVAQREIQSASIQAAAARAALAQAEESLRLHQAALGESTSAAELAPLASPIDGVVSYAHAALGQQVAAGERLFDIVDPAALWIEVQVYEGDLAALQGSIDARIVLDAYPADTYDGVLAAVGAVLDEATRTTTAVVTLKSHPADRLKVGLLAHVSLLAGAPRKGLAVPRGAVAEEEGGPVVFIHRTAETFERVRVELGATDGSSVIVRSGVRAGDRVVTEGVEDVRRAGVMGAVR
ncbi:MAG: efflux RND transporter periplasmic adaptor subunit [Acidobacteriota bacterium]